MRALDRGERMLHWVHAPGGMHMIARASMQGELDVARLRGAFESLRRRYQVLRHALGGTEAAPVLVPLPPDTPLPMEVLPRESRQHSLALVEQKLAAPRALPQLWRITVLHGEGGAEHDLIVEMHHAVCDGQSMFRVLVELMRHYEDPRAELPEVPIRESVEALLRKRIPSWLKRFALGWRSFVHESKKRQRPAATLMPAAVTGPRAPIVREATLPRELIERLRQRCRERGATMHGLYSGAMLTATRELLVPEGALSCGASVDMRPYCGLPSDAFGCFISNIETRHDKPASLWDLAREYKAQAKALIERHLPLGWIFLIGVLVRDPKRLRQALERGTGRQQTIFVSNLGFLPPQNVALKIVSAAGYVAQHQTGATAWLGTATLDDFAVFAFLFTAPLVDPALADRFVARFRELLRAEG